MLTVYIGPNGYGKTTKLNNIKKVYDAKEPRNTFMLNSELVLENEMKDTINDSMMMDYIINDILSDEETINARTALEQAVDKSIEKNVTSINDILSYALSFNNKTITKDVLELRADKEYKKLVKINADDLKKSMGSGQKIIFLLSLIKISKRDNIFLDEPENHCHPSLIHELAKIINELSKTKKVYLSTHSPILLSLLDVEFNQIFVLNDPNFENEKQIDFKDAVCLEKGISIGSMNDKSKTYFDVQTLKCNIKEIHNKAFFESLFSKKVYIVEGINDELFLKKMLYNYSKQYDDYSIFCSYGKPHMIPFVKIFQQLGIEVVVLYDSDEEKYPDDVNNKNINSWLHNNSKTYCFNDNLEHEIKFSKKNDTPEFIRHLDNFNFEKYRELIE